MDPSCVINLQSPYDDKLYNRATIYPMPSKILVLGGTMSVEELTPDVQFRLPNRFPTWRFLRSLGNGSIPTREYFSKEFLLGPSYRDMSKLAELIPMGLYKQSIEIV